MAEQRPDGSEWIKWNESLFTVIFKLRSVWIQNFAAKWGVCTCFYFFILAQWIDGNIMSAIYY